MRRFRPGAIREAARLGLVLFVALAAFSSGAWADDAKPMRGVALVVGESRYEHLTPLSNPANDARAIDRMLGDLGFEVTSVLDGDRDRLVRSLGRFVEDAAEADVALLYYSGHGIEAGGENYLVPIDADLSAPADPANDLVAVSALLADLKSKVPIAIVLLDACRTNPFPADAVVATASGPVPIAAAGLDLTRSAVALNTTAAGTDKAGLGQVIGFAAEPGHAALDGEAGGNSPYAAALLKHLAAGGFDFGDVMTMVSQEVYVRTGGVQSPWTNTNLRRVLYFGLSPEPATGDEASIRGERRRLLLKIASTPVDMRSLVENVAVGNQVPLDALYGMLDVLEVDTAGGPADLRNQLETGAQRLRTILAERNIQLRQDPELIRLSGLADHAETEGAIALALQFRDRASARAELIDKAIDEAEADIKARRLELADTFASHAKTALLNFDYRTAADRYGEASAQLERWDPAQAFLYKISQADALTDQGMVKGDNAALVDAIDVYEQAKRMPGVEAFQAGAVGVTVNQGITYLALADRDNGTKWVERAIAVYDEALRKFSPKRMPEAWATVQLNLGNAYNLMGRRAGGVNYHKKALEAFRRAAKIFTPKVDAQAWAGLQNNIGNALVEIGEAGDGKRNFSDAVKAFRAALTVWTKEAAPVNWAMVQHNLGSTLLSLGEIENNPDDLEAAAGALNLALEVRTRDTQPMDWAGTKNSLGNAYLVLGQHGKGPAYFEQALGAFNDAQLEITRERDPFNWASVSYNKARALKFMGDAEDSVARYRQALEEVGNALSQLDKEKAAILWGRATSVKGEILFAIGSRTGDAATLNEARQAYLAARDLFRAQKFTTNFEKFYEKQLKLINEQLAGAGKAKPATSAQQ